MADELKASPQEPITGALAKALGWMAHPTVDGHEIKPHLNLPSLLLPLESGAKFFENRSYGKPWTTGAGGLGGTQNLAPDVRDFSLDVAPYVPDVARLAGKGAKAIGKGVGEAMSQFAPSGSGPKTLTSQVGAIKPKGGNWFTGEVEKSLKGLRSKVATENVEHYTPEQAQRMTESGRFARNDALNNWVDKNLTNYVKNQMGTPEDPVRKLAEEGIVHKPFEDLEQYTKDDLGKFRAEQGFPPEGLGKSPEAQAWENESDLSLNAKKAKSLQELPEKLAQAEIARKEAEQAKINLDAKLTKHLESKLTGVTDQQIKNLVNGMGFTEKERMIGDDSVTKAYEKLQKLQSFDDEYNLKRLENNPWINKVAPETNIYSSQTGGLGFDHIIDVLKEDVANGRLHHDNLKNVSMEQAVRRTHEYDQEMAKKMAEAQIKITEGMPVHKEYPEGYKWIELTSPKTVPKDYALPEGMKLDTIDHPRYGILHTVSDPKGITQIEATNSPESALLRFYNRKGGEGYKVLEDALKYEGDTMGHCVGGYCPDVAEGRSRIYSLRDAKGEPHVTVETNPTGFVFSDIRNAVGDERANEMLDRGLDLPAMAKEIGYMPANEKINQIKGKGNKKPVDKYLPMVQDFVKSGNWGDVGDLHNTGLQKIGKEYLTQSEADAIYNPKIEQANKFLDTHPAFEPHRLADREYLDAIGKEFSTNDPVYTRHEMNELERRTLQPVHPDIPYTFNEMKAGLNRPEEYGSDDNYEFLSRRLNDIDKLRQIHGDVPPVEPTPNVPPMPPETPQFKRGGAVTFTDNPDAMMMEVNDRKFGVGGQVSKLVEKAIKIPTKFERATPLTKEAIDAMAERMAPQVTGEFVRAKPSASNPNPSTSVTGKSQKQFENEKNLGLVTRDIKPTVKPSEFDYTDPKNKGKVLIGTSGDVTPTNKEILEIKGVPIEPTEQQGGPEYGLYNKGIWAASNDQAQAYQDQAKKASEAYGGAEPLLHYHRMTDEANLYAMHHLQTLLNYMKPEELAKIDPSKYGQLVKLIQEKDVGFGLHPQFGGFEDPLSTNLHAQIDPDFRRHVGKILQMPSTSKNFGLRSGLDVLAATSEPELRNLEAGAGGFAIAPVDIQTPYTPYGSSNRTYETDILGGEVQRSKYPVPYQLAYPDATQFLIENPPKKGANNVFGRLNFTKPRQIIDQQFQDEVGQYMDKMKELTGKKDGGEVHMAGGGKVGLAKSAVEMMEEIMAKLGQKAIPVAEAEANKAKFLEPSKVKDVLYHGTNKDINSFKVPKNALGVWATKDSDVAKEYATISARGVSDPPSIYPIHASLKNPANKEQFGDAWELASKDSSRLGWNTHDERHRKILQDQGFDGAILDDSVVVFDPKNIKSAIGNQGTYDITNPDITKKKGGEVHLAGGGLITKIAENLENKIIPTIETGARRLKLGEILPKEEANENLRKMLESSKIKERLYHATPNDVKFFKPGGLDPRVSGEAIWLSNDPTRTPAAHNIGSYDNPKTGVNVMPVHVQAKNPLVIDDEGMLSWARDVYGEGSAEFPYLMPKKWRDKVSEDYDSIVLADPYNRGDSHEIIMFEPEKIKSAIGNRGTYNTDTADITKKNGGEVHLAGGGSASKALEAMLAEAPELANTIRGLFKAEAPTLGSLVDKLRTPDRQSVLPMPNRWFLDPENHPEVQGLVQKVLDANGMNRSDFHSGAYVDPKTGKIIDTQIHNDVGVAIDPITNRPVMTTGGVSGMEQLPSNWRDVGSATKSNLVKQGKFQPVGGDPILNDIGFLSTIEKSGAGHKYGLGMEYANPTMLHNTLTGDNPTLRPQSYGDLFGIGDVVGKVQTTKTGPIHDVYEKLLVAPKGSDVKGVKLNKKNGGKVTMTTNPDAMQMELHNKAFKRK